MEQRRGRGAAGLSNNRQHQQHQQPKQSIASMLPTTRTATSGTERTQPAALFASSAGADVIPIFAASTPANKLPPVSLAQLRRPMQAPPPKSVQAVPSPAADEEEDNIVRLLQEKLHLTDNDQRPTAAAIGQPPGLAVTLLPYQSVDTLCSLLPSLRLAADRPQLIPNATTTTTTTGWCAMDGKQ